jgi:hypothetical protein
MQKTKMMDNTDRGWTSVREVRPMQTFLKYPPVTVITLDTTAFFNNSNYSASSQLFKYA